MDKSKWLSSNQIENIIKSQKSIHNPFISYKDDENFLSLSDNDKQKFIDNKIDEQFNLYEDVNIKSIENLGIIEWLDERMESIYLTIRNKPQFMGKTINGKIYLNTEETLFLIESNQVLCYYKSLQLSLQDAYSLMIKNQLEFERYMVYSFLLRYGYRVIRNINLDNKIDEHIEEEEEEQLNLNKRSNSLDSIKQFKKIKLINEEKIELFENEIKIIPLKQLINDLNFIDDNFKLMKFIRFQKLINKTQSSWDDVLNEFNINKINFDSTSFLIENIFNNNNLPKQINDDFIDEYSIIKLNELLTEDQIKQRLIDNGPQIDLDDYFTINNFEIVESIDESKDEPIVESIVELKDELIVESKDESIVESKDETIDESIVESKDEPIDKLIINEKDNNYDNDLNYDYIIYLPNKKERIQDSIPNYYLKIIHSSKTSNFPIDLIFKLNSKLKDKHKLLFVFCTSNELNFYNFTDVDLINC